MRVYVMIWVIPVTARVSDPTVSTDARAVRGVHKRVCSNSSRHDDCCVWLNDYYASRHVVSAFGNINNNNNKCRWMSWRRTTSSSSVFRLIRSNNIYEPPPPPPRITKIYTRRLFSNTRWNYRQNCFVERGGSSVCILLSFPTHIEKKRETPNCCQTLCVVVRCSSDTSILYLIPVSGFLTVKTIRGLFSDRAD